MAEPMNAAEVALLNDRNNILGGGGGAMIWIIALIFLFLGGGNFGFGNNGRGDYVTQSDLANEEMGHMNILHTHVTRLIDEYKKKNGDPPEAMLLLYDILHKKHIENAAYVKALLGLYKP